MPAEFEEGPYSEQWPEIPPPPRMKMYVMIVISLELFMNLSDRLRRLGTLVDVQLTLEIVPRKSAKNLPHQATYNNDVTFLDLCLKVYPYQLPELCLKISENDIHSYHTYLEER